jgi:hypothetical protein
MDNDGADAVRAIHGFGHADRDDWLWCNWYMAGGKHRWRLSVPGLRPWGNDWLSHRYPASN